MRVGLPGRNDGPEEDFAHEVGEVPLAKVEHTSAVVRVPDGHDEVGVRLDESGFVEQLAVDGDEVEGPVSFEDLDVLADELVHD